MKELLLHKGISGGLAFAWVAQAMLVLLVGALLGLAAKYLDGTVFGLIGTYLGFWVFTTTVIAAWSRSPVFAALHAFLFLGGMLIAYYAYSTVLFGFFPASYFYAWGAIALVSPIGGFIVWFAKREGWVAAFCASLPIGIIAAEGHSFYYTYSLPEACAMVWAMLLLVILPPNGVQRLRTLFFSVLIAFLVVRFGILYFFPA